MTSERDRTRCAALLVVWLAVLSQGGCSPAPDRSSETSGRERERPNLVLLSIDTLRADHLGSYGYRRPTSPALDRLAARSVRYAHAFSPAGWTFPAHVALLTGRHPYELGLRGDPSPIPTEVPTLAETLRALGYQTAAFVDSGPDGFVGGKWGFARGFDVYRHAPHVTEPRPPFKYDVRGTVASGLAWLAARSEERPFFLFLHTKSVHALPRGAPCADPRCLPYDQPEPFRFRFLPEGPGRDLVWGSAERGTGQDFLWSAVHALIASADGPANLPRGASEVLAALYDGGIAYADDGVQRLLDGLAALGVDGRTVVAVTSDHGEAFGEHRLFMHVDAYDEVLRVPLLIRPIGQRKATVVDEAVSTVELAPTLLRLLDAGDDRLGVAGVPVSGEARARAAPLFAFYRLPSEVRYEAYALREGPWKLVLHDPGVGGTTSDELYDWRSDPAERTPVTDQPARRAAMRDRLMAWRRQAPALSGPTPAEPSVPEESLRALGYVE